MKKQSNPVWKRWRLLGEPPYDLYRAAASFEYLWDRHGINTYPWPRNQLPRQFKHNYGLTLEQSLEAVMAGDFLVAHRAGKTFDPETSWALDACIRHMKDADKAATVFCATHIQVQPFMTHRFFRKAEHCILLVGDYRDMAIRSRDYKRGLKDGT